MAGIGFELKKILKRDTFLSEFKAYFYAALVSSGPWLMSVVCLGILGITKGTGLSYSEHEIFRSTIVYTYAFSLMYVGSIQLVVTRYLADQLYLENEKITLPTFFTCMVLVLGGGSVFSVLCYFPFKISLLHKFDGIILFLLVSMIWVCMIFLSVIKDFVSIVYAFAGGTLTSIFAAPYIGKLFGTEGYLMGYTLGQAVIFFWLLSKILIEFPVSGLWNKELFQYFRKYWDLIVIGFVYNLAIWSDKMVFWFAPDSRLIVPWFRTHDFYEGAVFFSYLTIVPALALFMVNIETNFYEHYRHYYGKIMGKQSLSSIRKEKNIMVSKLKDSLRMVFIFQGAITSVCLIFAPILVRMAHLIPVQIPIFRISLIGSFLQILLAMNIIILFYFDLRRHVMAVALLFLFSNVLFSMITTKLGVSFYGYGYAYACFVSLMLAFHLLDKSVNDLEYITFAKQPVH
ncbi:MAG: exopolysaccharide Pel transporter PelG [Candidatus Scalindua sp.]|nr:exopolysaccharide Pel transporter PelG [Candidatus Scalindua sp.]